MALPPAVLKIAQFTLIAVTNAHREISPYSFTQTPYDFQGGMWRASIDLTHLDRRDSATIQRWVAGLEGPVGTFELPALDYEGPFGTMTDNPVIAVAAAARAKTISVEHVAGSALVPDDQITIDGHLHVVLTAGAVDLSDVQVITIWPRLRAAVTVGQAVNALTPFGTWALANRENGFARAQNYQRSQSIDLMEAL